MKMTKREGKNVSSMPNNSKVKKAFNKVAGVFLKYTQELDFDPGKFEDPVALRTVWTPAVRGGTRYCTRKLVSTDSERFEFRASPIATAVYCMVIITGLTISTYAIYQNHHSIFTGGNMWNQSFPIFIPVVFGLVFSLTGACMWYFGTKPIVFDKKIGQFWKGRLDPMKDLDGGSARHFTGFKDIHAIQLLSENCFGKNSSFYSYELNLVLENGKQINVIDHGNLEQIRRDAKTLSGFLGKPIWDVI